MEGGDRRIVDYFIVAGLPEHDSRPLGEVDVHDEGVPKSRPVSADPITDIAVIIRSEDEFPPHGFDCIEITPSGLSANLNYGSIRCPEMYLCYRRGRDRPPLLDIGVMYAGKDSMRPDSQVLEKTPYGRPANVNNASLQTFLTYRRAREESPCNELVVTDICIILPGKGERPPHSFFKIDKNLNRGMVGSDVYVCYKKSMNRPNSIIYEPEILWRYPEEDYVDCPLPTSLATFCLPLGATLEWWPPKAKMPGSVFSTFVLSVSNPLDEGSVKSWYGAAVSFYEPFPASKVSHEQRRLLFYPEKDDPLNLRAFARKCVCFLSHWPFFQAYENFLTFLQRYAFSGEAHRIPIERHLSHFMHYVPFPTPQRPFVFAQLSATERLSLYLPPDSPLRLSGAKFRELLNNLDLDRIVQVIVMVLLEQKILLHSLRPDVLTSVAEALSMVIFPFQWQCPYIPLCPLGLANVISAPMPFLVGVDSRYFDLYDPPDGVICVDLDTNSLRIPADKEWMVSKVVPKRCIKPLMAALKDLQQRCFSMADEERRRLRERAQAKDPAVYVDPDADMKWERKQSFLEMDIQEAFIVFMAGLLKGYQLYLKPVSSQPRASEPTDLFDSEGFLRSRDKVYHSFYRVLVDTQMFTHFIQERSFTSSKDVSLAFFDDVVEKMENEEESLFRLLDRDSPHNQQAAMILPPEPDDLPEGVTYTYDGFDKLDVKLMIRPKAKAMLNNFKGKLHDGLSTPGGSGPGSSPMVARRIKHEIRQAQKIVKKHADCQFTWGKALLSCSISIWFTHLPSYMLWYKEEKSEVLQKAYEILLMVQDFKLKLIDEVWFRVMMQLCNQYKEGPMAVKVFALMKVLHVVPNALTYGHYNRAMLDARWSTSMSDRPSARAWRKLRNIIHVLATWKAHVRARPVRKISLSSEENISRSSMESGLSSKVPEQIAENHCESSSSNSRADDESSKGLTTPVKGKKSFFFKKRHHSSEKSKSKLLSFNSLRIPKRSSGGEVPVCKVTLAARDEDEPDAEGDADEEHEKEDMLGNEETPIFPAEEKTQEILEEEKPTSPVPSSNSEEKEDKRFYESSTPSREQSQDRDAEKSGFYSTSRESSMEFKVSGLRTDSLSSVEEFKAQAAQASQKVMNWGVRLIQGGTDLVEKTKIRLVRGGSEDSKLSDEEKDDEPPQFLAPEPPKRTASPMAKSPTRTPVTENDPLGAFSSLEKANNYQTNSLPPNVRLSPIHGQPSDAKLPQITTPVAPMAPGTPRRVSLSSYGSNSSLDSPLPGGLASSLSSISSNLRKSMRFGKTFGFKTPVAQRGVVRQLLTPSNEGSNEFHRCNTHLGLVDTYKASVDTPPRNHSNHSVVRESPGMDARHSELFSGMSSSLRTAATSISKRLDSFMDAVTFTPPPNPLRHSSVYAASSQEDGMSEIDRFRGSQDSLTRMTPKRDSDSLSLSSISRTGVSPGVDPQSKVSPFRGIFARHLCCGPVGLSVRMYSCGTCHGCKAVLYDEEILSGWSPEDSNLNTKCPYCGRTEVPQLTVLIRDFRSKPMVDDVDIAVGDGADKTSDEPSVEKFDGLPVDPIVVPYLSPFVLRKELESLLESEGDCCLLEPTFVDQHGIIYWNMVWFFLRIHAPSHLIDLAIKAPGIRPSCKQSDVHPSWEAATASNVDIRCYWDEPGLHFVDEDASSSERLWQMPLYLNWRGNRTAEVLDCPNAVDLVALQNLSKQIFAAITTENRLIHPVELILTELREKWNVEKCGPPNSVYREILFLSLVNCGRNIIDLWSFDREYKRAYESLKPLLKAKIRDTDMPPSHRTSLCQRMFAQLLLPTDIK